MILDLVKEYTLKELEELVAQNCPICQSTLTTHVNATLPNNWSIKCSKCDFNLVLFRWQDGMFTCFGADWQCYTVALGGRVALKNASLVVSANRETLLNLHDETMFDFNKWLPKLDKLLLLS